MNSQEIKEKLANWQSIVKNYQKPNTRKAIVQMVTSYLPFFAIWVLMYFSLGISYWLTLGLAILNAFFLVRIFIIQHDCGHQSFLKNRRANNVIGFISSFFSLIPYKYWARSHNFHHAHNGQLEVRDIGDITTLTVNEYRARSSWGRFKYWLYRTPVVLFFIGPLYYLFLHQRMPSIQLKGWKAARRSAWLTDIYLLVFYLSLGLLIGWQTFIMVQLPIIVFFAIIAIWFFYVQHQHVPTYKQWKKNWDFLLASVKGSTYYKLPKLFQWLTGNIGFHHIHHLSSLIPNYNLERCNRENPIFEKCTTVLTFRESLKCIFNKLWDEESQRMISFREFYRMEKKQLSM